MNFAIRLETAVVKTLDRVDRPTEKRLRNRIDALAADPFDPRLSEPLTGKGDLRKSRVGGWRIVFEVDVRARWIAVTALQRRGQVYKRL
ncbi:MAG: type II toxin-antitoxin system RelE/ParE family toxin [Acidobacteria bacterium]|nr:type II toxin-antitoxin system RelE/ParE family toxin [Acidobacteriota bacterium]